MHDNSYEQRKKSLDSYKVFKPQQLDCFFSEANLLLELTGFCGLACFKFYRCSIPEASFTAASYLFPLFQNL